MLGTDRKRELLPTALRYFLQLVSSYPVVMLAGFPLSRLLSVFGLSGEHPSQTHFAGYLALSCLFVGPFIGWVVGHKVPSFVPSGRWIWVLPTVIFCPGVAGDLLSRQQIPWLPESVFATGSNEGLGVFLVTLPACSALGYSIGMALVTPKAKWTKLPRLGPMPHPATIILAWVALVGILAILAHRFEMSRIESWSRVRTVIGRPGLWLSADPNLLCSAPASNRGRLLPTATLVEGLERRACVKDRLLDADAPESAGSWNIERVKVLNGSNAGVEGWVLDYGLLETLKP
ncbi:MAG: hypothetical protein ABSH47_17870 [Bryobacteraceae bacterium]